jgi:protocatechuate 3,4-dioxygenase beta subunit
MHAVTRHGGHMQRREAILSGLAASLAGTIPAAKLWSQTPSAAGACVLTVDGDEGPFYFDSRLVRADITEGKPGMPLELTMRIVTAGDCAPITDARADLWQADALGLYSGYDNQTGVGLSPAASTKGDTFLRGTQFTDREGVVVFRTIYPSWYRGRTPHLHFKVYLGNRDVVTNQIIFPEDVNDRVLAQPPYNEHGHVRDTFNAADTFLSRDGSGVLCNVLERGAAYQANVLVAVRRG